MVRARGRHLKVLTGRAHPALAKEVAKHLGVPLGKVDLGNFANGEISCKLGDSVRGEDVFIVQSHSAVMGAGSVNDALMEQLLMIDAAKRASARSITAVCPFLGYARQDRKASGREPITARLIVDLIAASGADRIISIDLHSGQTQGFFSGPFDHLIAAPTLLKYIQKNFGKDLVIVSPDAGRVKMSERYASELKTDMAIIHKHRSTTKKNSVEAKYLIGEVKGRNCLIMDDMIDTAGTICAAADLLAKNGAKKIYGAATHGVLSDPALKRIQDSAFTKVVVTNTLPLVAGKKDSKIATVTIAPLIADAINAIFAYSSVSAIFGGKNQF